MFKPDEIRKIKEYYNEADLITVRANKGGLQYCIFEIDSKTGGFKILNEGNLKTGKVLGFDLNHRRSNCETKTEHQQLIDDAYMGKVLYSIRAKFYDRYNVRHCCDYDIEELIFNKLDELEKVYQTKE